MLAVTAALSIGGCATAPQVHPPKSSAAADGAAAAPLEPMPDASAGSIPARVVAAAIDLDEPLVELGLTGTGEMEVPDDYGDVGWFTGGGRPGGVGPTVLAGHVDSTTGPAVFDRLAELTPGETVTLFDAAGRAADYRVVRSGDFDKERFPTAEVFGAVLADEIRLITCAGDFDGAVGSYEQNLVVFGVRL